MTSRPSLTQEEKQEALHAVASFLSRYPKKSFKLRTILSNTNIPKGRVLLALRQLQGSGKIKRYDDFAHPRFQWRGGG